MAKSQVVVVTGASAGVGRAVVRAFARRKARIGLLARGRDGLDAARREVEAAGGEALAIPTDVADPAQVEAAAEAVESTFGPLDIWVNDAMTSVFAPVLQLRPEELRRVTEVTYLGAAYGTMAALRRMVPRDAGVIVQVGSALAFRSIPLQAAYCGAKHALVGFTESLRCELLHEHSGVRVTMVHMPALNTPQFDWVRNRMPRRPQPVPPIYQPEVAAAAVVHAALHPRRRQTLVGGSTVLAVEGNKIAAGLLDRYLGKTGYASQQTPEPSDPNQPDNLFAPVAGDHGARGRFSDRSSPRSYQLRLNQHAGAVLAGAALAVAAWLAPKVRRTALRAGRNAADRVSAAWHHRRAA